MKKKILIIASLCMIALGAIIISDKIYKSTDMTGNVLEEVYSKLDEFGRCGVAYTNIS